GRGGFGARLVLRPGVQSTSRRRRPRRGPGPSGDLGGGERARTTGQGNRKSPAGVRGGVSAETLETAEDEGPLPEGDPRQYARGGCRDAGGARVAGGRPVRDLLCPGRGGAAGSAALLSHSHTT